MFSFGSSHTRAVLQALLVTFLWSTSWVLIKVGLQGDLPPLTFAGLRYTTAFMILLPLLLRRPEQLTSVRQLTARAWLGLIILGFLYYTLNQGAQFFGLALLPSATVNLLLSFSAVVVTLLGSWLLAEQPTPLQWLGVALYVGGVMIYFYPVTLPTEQITGLLIVLVGVFSNAGAALLGRRINREQHLHPLVVTTISMGIGAVLLLAAGILTQGLPNLTLVQWGIIAWLALVNTAFAFTLWNHTLRTLSAMESSIINNAMLIQIPLLAWLFLGETFDSKEMFAFLLAGIGILVVQLKHLPASIRRVRHR